MTAAMRKCTTHFVERSALRASIGLALCAQAADLVGEQLDIHRRSIARGLRVAQTSAHVKNDGDQDGGDHCAEDSNQEGGEVPCWAATGSPRRGWQ